MKALVLLILAGPLIAAQSIPTSGGQTRVSPVISFDVAGGDTWRFAKQISGEIKKGTCDTVSVTTFSGNVRALLQKRRFLAEVRLHAGVNDVRAHCWRAGAEVARSATLRWIVRLQDTPRAWIRTRVSGASVLM
ncbi:MAG: Alpha-glucosidase, partial [Gammaproteobacteria bacterium]|nr:Alpha-glucosidase [Gammaproteobacteria bacterium]